jgi:hypothetical protein
VGVQNVVAQRQLTQQQDGSRGAAVTSVKRPGVCFGRPAAIAMMSTMTRTLIWCLVFWVLVPLVLDLWFTSVRKNSRGALHGSRGAAAAAAKGPGVCCGRRYLYMNMCRAR